MPPWLSLITGPLMPILQSVGKFLADYFQKQSYIKQGKQEQQLIDLKQKVSNEKDTGKIESTISGMGDAELDSLLRGGRPKAD